MDIKTSVNHVPLCVDLDGTLLSTDTLWEGLATLLLRKPYLIFSVVFWIFQGKALLKQNVAERNGFSGKNWPIRREVIDYIARARSQGRLIYLVTGAPQTIANSVAEQVGLFHGVMHSDSRTNLTSTRKRNALVARFGDGGYDYMGNSRDDIAVFDSARRGIVVAPDSSAKRWQKLNNAEEVKVRQPNAFAILKAIRVHQWLKNILLAVPLILNHEFFQINSIYALIYAFFSFSFFASSVYLVNDLSDLENDRQHKSKRKRPLARGDISIPTTAFLWVALVSASLGLAAMLPPQFFIVLAIYAFVTTAYTFILKRKLLIDVFTLAGLYTIRIIAGAAATGNDVTFWLLAFSIFFFLSLALVKRYVEMAALEDNCTKLKFGRGYAGIDSMMLGQAGVSSAFAAAMVLALYIHSDEIANAYDKPWILWPLVPIILFMLLRIWILARRGQMHDDPVVFIMRDWRSQLTMIGGASLVLAAVMF